MAKNHVHILLKHIVYILFNIMQYFSLRCALKEICDRVPDSGVVNNFFGYHRKVQTGNNELRQNLGALQART